MVRKSHPCRPLWLSSAPLPRMLAILRSTPGTLRSRSVIFYPATWTSEPVQCVCGIGASAIISRVAGWVTSVGPVASFAPSFSRL